jgi:type III restriction enzyme
MEVKAQAAMRWVSAVNADGSYGQWYYAVARKPEEVRTRIEAVASIVRVSSESLQEQTTD